MKYNEGDKVRIKSKEWYDNNKDEYGNVHLMGEYGWMFTERDSRFCGKVVTIFLKGATSYAIVEDSCEGFWIDEMIECKVEDEPKFKVGDIIAKAHLRLRIVKIEGNKYIVEERPDINLEVLFKDQDLYRLVKESKPNIIEEAKAYWDSIKDAWICLEGYIFKDENGNVINAQKIVLEKKKKEYPQTYEDCCKVLDFCGEYFFTTYEEGIHLPENDNIVKIHQILKSTSILTKLIICRDAYWKIAGEEMGLGKPWEPDWTNEEWPDMYYISFDGKHIDKEKGYPCCNMILIFPTAEMRDAFYENFKEEIEKCKELL